MALSAPGRVTPEYEPLSIIRSYPVDAGAVIYNGAIVCLDSTGYAVPGATATGLLAVGIAQQSVTGGTNDGDTHVPIHTGVFRLLTDSPFAQSDVGALAYIVDDETVSLTSTSRSIAGTVAAIEGAFAWIAMGLESAIDNTTLTAFENTLAGTGGAGIVGVLDSAGYFGSTPTVESALATKIVGARAATVTDNQLTTAIPVVLEFAVPDASSGHTDYVIADKLEITEVVVRKNTSNGGSGDTIQLLNSSTAITDAMSLNINTKLLVRAASIDAAQAVISAGGTLRVQWVHATNAACQVTVFGIRRA
jgi:hypothetical protein